MTHVKDLPWSNWQEWRELKADLWSTERERIEQGLTKVAVQTVVHDWSCVWVLPIEVEVTAALFKAECAWESSSCDSAVLEALYSVPLIRLTAAVRDQEETVTLRPGAELPLSVGLARNDYVHNVKPTLEHLRAAAKSATDFIRTHYWDYVEESLPTREQIIEAVQGCFALHERLAGKRLAESGMLEEFEKCLQPIYTSLDGDQLHSVLLDSISPLSDASDESFQSGLLEFCEGYGYTWLIYLAESWLERALLRFPASTITSSSSTELKPDLLNWGRVIAAALTNSTVELHALERDRILQKIMELLQHLIMQKRHVPSTILQSFWEVARQFFNCFHSQLPSAEPKKRLSTLFHLMEQEFNSQKIPSAAALPQKKSEGKRYGLFVQLQDWEMSAFGNLPYNYKPFSR